MTKPLTPDEVNALLGLPLLGESSGNAFADAFAYSLLYGTGPRATQSNAPLIGLFRDAGRKRPPANPTVTDVAQRAIAEVWACEHAALWAYVPIVSRPYRFGESA